MFIVLGLVFVLLYALIVFYIGRSGWTWIRPVVSHRFRLIYIAIVVFLASSLILSRVFEGAVILSVIGGYWLALFSLLALLLPVVHLIVWLTKLTKLPRYAVQKWSGVVTLILVIALLGYGSFNAFSPIINTYVINIDKEGPESGELHIVMASDMHFGYLSGASHARRMVEEINALRPDIVLLPGDLIDDDIVPYVDKGIGDILSGIKAPLGVFASLGNHDRFKGETETLIALIEESGINVLYDETLQVEGWLTLVGRKDYSDRGRAPLVQLTGDIDVSSPIFLLEHQPVELGTAQEQGIDLMVSGHTHYGQIAPANLITGLLFENDWGHLRKGQMHSIVTSGYGFWGPPIRIGSRAEIVSIHVRFSNAERRP